MKNLRTKRGGDVAYYLSILIGTFSIVAAIYSVGGNLYVLVSGYFSRSDFNDAQALGAVGLCMIVSGVMPLLYDRLTCTPK